MAEPSSAAPTGSVSWGKAGLRRRDLAVAAALLGVLLWHFGAGERMPGREARAASPRAAAALPAEPVAATPYAPDSAERFVYDALNEARMRGDFGPLAQDARLDAAAAGHAAYLARHAAAGAPSHAQDPLRPGFTGETPLARLRAVGYDDGAASLEAIAGGAGARACLELLNTVYHLGVLMAAGATEVGIAAPPNGGCVIEPQRPRRAERLAPRGNGNSVGVYPTPGQAGVPTAFMPATEMPNPAPDLGESLAGPPILVDLDAAFAAGVAASRIVVERYAVIDAATGEPLAARVLAGAGVKAGAAIDLRTDRRLPSAGQVFLLPLAPLRAGARYAVDFAAAVDGAAVARRWEFSTAVR